MNNINEKYLCRDAILEAFATMAERKDVLQDTHGNLSVLISEREMLIKPSGVPYEKITRNNVCHVEFTDDKYPMIVRIQTNGFKPSVDAVHHARIYLNNPHIKSICHTHSPHVVAHAIAGMGISCLCTEHADYFGDTVRAAAYKDLDEWGDLFIEENEKALILEKHGALTFAKNPKDAVNLAVQLENVARKNFLARSLVGRGGGLLPLPAEERMKWHRRYNTTYGQ